MRSTAYKAGRTIATMALALGIGVLPLAACGAKPADTAEEPEAAAPAEETPEAAAPAEETPAANNEFPEWKTLGDALANKTGDLSYVFNDDYVCCAFEAGDAMIRAVAKSSPDLNDKINAVDYDDPDYDAKIDEVLADLELLSAEDFSDTQLSQEELDSYVGKTGQDMLDAGFTIDGYFMDGSDEAVVSMDYGYYGYEVTFDKTVTEDQISADSNVIKDATVTAVESHGYVTDAALNPQLVEE